MKAQHDKELSQTPMSEYVVAERVGTMASPSRAELLQMFQSTATEIVEKEFKSIAEATKISELGIDSLGMLEIIGSLERQLKVQIPDESLAGLTTVRDLLEAVEMRFKV
jgi:acyl carrier protein